MAKKKRVVPSKSHIKKSTPPGLSLSPTVMDTLGQIARKMGLSRSALIEQIIKGEIAIASSAARTTISLEPTAGLGSNGRASKPKLANVEAVETTSLPKRTLDSPVKPNAGASALQQQLEETRQQCATKDEQIAELQNQLKAQKSLAESKEEGFQALQGQSRQQEEQIARLQDRLNEQQSLAEGQSGSVKALQQQCQERDEAIAQLQEQLSAQKSIADSQTESIEALTKQSREQEKLTAQLQEQLSDRHAQNIRTLEQQCQERDRQIETLQQQLAGALREAESYRDLERQSEEQANLIANLQEEVARLQSLAHLGELQVNRWSSRTFSR